MVTSIGVHNMMNVEDTISIVFTILNESVLSWIRIDSFVLLHSLLYFITCCTEGMNRQETDIRDSI